ncbi:MAG: xanthine dehydrogenase family protein subunit M [Proteobacteria bacterium]|nr:xanthine dehydrogenase family protein subunit M [Pseudomonadota bacterium]MBU1581986.1 xanthine dehydrogenase family protein subunit M [Pseudomonadota bacterium]MBU2454701.1 xanthine dehydrogenase family protein subunit M [Pseudomonadota bacterium]MBU2628951.1 xanthine dehydrogenase family protein subunit M [Pseudomonadota bacterium]
MRIRPFDFKVADSLADALKQLDQTGPDARLIAGGTDLVLNLKKKTVQPKVIISLHLLKDLECIEEKNDVIHIGALAKHADLAIHPILEKHASILCQAVGLIGSWQIRNAGTIGGNICNASPAADSAPPLLVLDADVVVAGLKGDRIIPVTSFFTGPGQTVMEPNEILKEIRFKPSVNPSAGCYLKLRRRKAVDISLVGVAFQAQTDATGKNIEKVGIALGGVAPTPIRVPEAESCFKGISIDKAFEKIKLCAQASVEAAKPIDDLRASADYKRTIVNVFVQRCAQQVLTELKIPMLKKIEGDL